MRQSTVTNKKKRLDGAERRQQILKAAKELFLNEGIERTSMRNIAARAEITPALIYQHFSDKEALLRAITEDYFETLVSYMKQANGDQVDPVSSLRAYMEAYMQCGLDHPREYHLAFMTGLPRLSNGNMRHKLAAIKDGSLATDTLERNGLRPAATSYELFESAISAAIDADLTTSRDVDTLSQTIWAATHGLISLKLTRAEFTWAEKSDLITSIVEAVLNGILRRS